MRYFRSMASGFPMGARHRRPAGRNATIFLLLLGFAIFGLLAGPWSASIQSGLSPISSPGRVTDSSLTSWNPHVSCSADLVTIRDVLGPAYPSQTVNGSRYQTNSTAGGIPQERALAPPCTITNKTGTVVSSFVQINGVSLYGYGVKTTDCSGWYSKQNGGGRYPGNKTFCTNAGQIITIGTTRGYMKIEIDRDWLGKGYCGVGVPYCDNATLGNYQSNGSISLDIQGFVFWEGPWHWEIHPMTGWKLSAPPTPPSAPRNLAATGGNAQVTLNWQAPASDGGSPVTNYRIYRGAASGTKTLLTTVGAVLTYTDGAVTNGLTYYYQVSAVNGPGEGAKSNEASATPNPPPPPPSPPSAPTNLVATGGNAQVALTWQAPASNGGSQITNYRVYRGTTSGGKTLLATLGVVTSYTDTSVTNGVTYYYQVSAVNSVGEGPRSNEATATPSAPAAPPTAPQGLVATGGVGTVTLVWSPPSNNGGSPVTNYRIYRGTSSNGETLLTTIGNVLTYIDTAVTNGVTYYYQVSAVNSVGEGPRSNEASATPSAPPPPPNFGISASPVSLSIHIGSSGTSTITLTSLNGFAGTISLSTSIACSGVCVVYPTASLNPTSVTLSAGGTGASTLTVSTSVLTTPGTYTVTITATSGSITHTVTVTVQVYV
jgi:fibronectin type 3 domain-containing protein